MKKRKSDSMLSRRQEQIMAIIYRLGEASVADIMEHLPESPTSGAVRRMINILHNRGFVEYRHDGAKKIYTAKIKKSTAKAKALNHVVETFFAGSSARTMASLMNNSDIKLSDEDKATLRNLIEKAKAGGQ